MSTEGAKQRETAQLAEPMFGDKLFQQRARMAFPILVRQAHAAAPILYSELAAEIGMSNPRNLNYVLGSIGQTLVDLSAEWDREIPPINCLVINKSSGLPGEGISWFIKDVADFKELPLKRKREIVDIHLQEIYAFQDWLKILEHCGLEPVCQNYKQIINLAENYRGGGESERHKRLKRYVSTHPEVIGLPSKLEGREEHPLPSGDSLDVLFHQGKRLIGVEVKSARSPDTDIVRGIFQCVKYQAVLEAVMSSQSLVPDVQTLLVLEGELPKSLVPLKNMLRVEVIQNILPR
ncbi:MAG: hypothetical protein JXN60_01370 [Lentisphaerae bacterium]|nr:hypothetical protein [Lentisphaerota bacterium]